VTRGSILEVVSLDSSGWAQDGCCRENWHKVLAANWASWYICSLAKMDFVTTVQTGQTASLQVLKCLPIILVEVHRGKGQGDGLVHVVMCRHNDFMGAHRCMGSKRRVSGQGWGKSAGYSHFDA